MDNNFLVLVAESRTDLPIRVHSYYFRRVNFATSNQLILSCTEQVTQQAVGS
jgi:hypothetical protein